MTRRSEQAGLRGVVTYAVSRASQFAAACEALVSTDLANELPRSCKEASQRP